MDRLIEWVRGIPPVTRYWLGAILTSSLLTKLKLVTKVNLAFIPEKALGSQPWRLITSFCFFDDLSLELMINIWLIVQSSRVLEGEFMIRPQLFPSSFDDLTERQKNTLQDYIDRNRTADYFYYILQICTSIVLVVTYGYLKFGFRLVTLGTLLDDILCYIWYRDNPNLVVNVLWFIRIRNSYLPWCYTLINLLFIHGFFEDVVAVLSGNFSLTLSMHKKSILWKVSISYVLAHFWWYTRAFLLPRIYHDSNTERRQARQKTLAEFNVKKHNLVREGLARLLLPPWYWVIVSRIRRTRTD